MNSRINRAFNLGGLRQLLDGVVLVLVACAAAAVLWRSLYPQTRTVHIGSAPGQRPEEPLPAQPIELKQAAIEGATTAKVILVEFSDFQCPYCAKFSNDILPRLRERYVRTGAIQIAFQHLPSPTHPFAQQSAEAAECARRQGKFWQLHDLLFARSAELGQEVLTESAPRAGVQPTEFQACLNGSAKETVAANVALGHQLNVSLTPTFFIGTRLDDSRMVIRDKISGAQPIEVFNSKLKKLTDEAAR
jgi:protein-disulfide isomerase